MTTSFHERFSCAIGLITARTRKTKKQIAEEINISPSALTQLTKGISKQASESTLMTLQKKYSVNPEWLLDGKGEIFVSNDGFEDLRPSIATGTDSYGGRYIVATIKGWAKILNYYYSEANYRTKLTMELANKINNWPGVANSVRPLYGNPIFMRNYRSAIDEENNNSLYSLMFFHLEGTPPKGFILADRASFIPGNIVFEPENRVCLKCRKILDVGFRSINLCNDYEYLIDLSQNEYIDILGKQPPNNLKMEF